VPTPVTRVGRCLGGGSLYHEIRSVLRHSATALSEDLCSHLPWGYIRPATSRTACHVQYSSLIGTIVLPHSSRTNKCGSVSERCLPSESRISSTDSSFATRIASSSERHSPHPSPAIRISARRCRNSASFPGRSFITCTPSMSCGLIERHGQSWRSMEWSPCPPIARSKCCLVQNPFGLRSRPTSPWPVPTF
jgi:hypothetical protein